MDARPATALWHCRISGLLHTKPLPRDVMISSASSCTQWTRSRSCTIRSTENATGDTACAVAVMLLNRQPSHLPMLLRRAWRTCSHTGRWPRSPLCRRRASCSWLELCLADSVRSAATQPWISAAYTRSNTRPSCSSSKLSQRLLELTDPVQCAGKTLTAPLDRVKLLLQTGGGLQQGSLRQAARKGVIPALAAIGREEGLRGYWKGNLLQVTCRCSSAMYP